MKKLLFVLLAGCESCETALVEKQLGEGSICWDGPDSALLCKSRTGKAYVCYMASKPTNKTTFCFEAIDAREIE